jgi:type I restriction enzyme R subunit
LLLDVSVEFNYVEKPFIDCLKSLGWNIILSIDDTNKFVPRLTLRTNFDEIIIDERLRDSLKRLNNWLEDDQVEEAFQEIKRVGLRKGLVEANEDFLSMLLEPPSYKNNKNPQEKNRCIKIIDFDHPEENDFLVINQFRVNTPGTLRDYIVPDIVLFVNGIPLVVVECKYPTTVDVEAMEEGITQLKRYSNTREDVREREGNERLFWYNQIMISTTRDEARAGTITSEYDHYLEWKDTYPMELDPKLDSQHKLILGALTKENLLDLIRNFTVFQNTEKGRVKLVGRYHQFRAVNKIVNLLLTKEKPEQRSGIVWHTQGSGKSLSMVFLIRKIRRIEKTKRLKVVIVTDRVDLQKQLKGTAGIAETPYVVENTKDISEELKTDTSNLVMVMAQKFLKRTKSRSIEDELPSYEEFPVLNNSEDILVLVDEAHRTQSGVFGDNIVFSLPNSSRIAFTGTPLITKKVKKRTYERFGVSFGDYIDKYGIRESINDGATLGIGYEGKTVTAKVKNKQKMDIEFEDMFADKTREELIAIKGKYGTKGDVLQAPKRIEAISKDLVKHYFENIFDNGFKAQVVASSRVAAVRYKQYIDKAVNEYIAEYEKQPNADPARIVRMKFLSSVVRITWLNNDNPQVIRLAKEAELKLGEDNKNYKSKFNLDKPNTSIAFLIVKDMLLTGFDAPVEQVMYVDKRMADHTLLQAIARVNRVTEGKDYGYVVDYYGITNHLKEALDSYSEHDLQLDDVLTDVNTELPLLKYRYEQLVNLFKDHKVEKIEDYVNYRIKNASDQLPVLENCLDVLEDIKTRIDFAMKFKLFLRSMDVLCSKPAGQAYIPPLKAFGHIHARAQSRFRDDSINILGAGKRVRKLIEDYLITIGIDTKIKPLDITADEFEGEVNRNRTPRSQASTMEHAIRKHCKVLLNTDPVYYKRISEKLEEILKRYKDNWDEQVRYLKQLRQEIREGRKAEESGLDPKKQAPFYDMLRDIAFKDRKLPETIEEQVKKIIINIVDVIALEISKVGFWGNPYKEKHLRALIDDILLYSNIPELTDNKECIVTDFIKLAKNRKEEILS